MAKRMCAWSALGALLILAAALTPAARASAGVAVTISEVMAKNGKTMRDERGQSSDWIELKVEGAAGDVVNLEGYSLTDDPQHKVTWPFPSADVPLAKGGYAVVFASGEDASAIEGKEATKSPTGATRPLHASFKLSDAGEYLAVLDPEGGVADEVWFERQYEDVSWGRSSSGALGYLSVPTPGRRNAAPAPEGRPFLERVTKTVSPPPASADDIRVTACVSTIGGGEAEVTVKYKLNFDSWERSRKMEPTGAAANATDCGQGYEEHAAVLKHTGARAGDMVRWYVTAERAGQAARSPALDGPEALDSPQYHGTVVVGKRTVADLAKPKVEKLYWFIKDSDRRAIERSQCSAFPCLADKEDYPVARASLYFQGRFYDNVRMRQRGISALLWPKKKFKVDFKGDVFKIRLPHRGGREISVEEFNLQSHWEEPGEETYMRENIASDFFAEAGLPVFDTLHVELVQNGKFYGLYSIVEQVDENFLERVGYNPKGHLYKAFSGTASNLNDRVPARLMDKVYRRGNEAEDEGDWSDLHDLTQSLAGKNRAHSSVEEYLYNHVNLPEVVNELALQAAILNQDRCTKNYYVYYDIDRKEWSRFAWDLEAVMGISSALGGFPAPDYCMLICPQFNSPLYCDSDHPQDPLPDFGKSKRNRGYVRKQAAAVPGLETPERNYNHLTDALLDTPSVRQMYLRRLKTIVDRYIAPGYLAGRVEHYYSKIRDVAKMDDQKWDTGDIWEGYEQLLKEQLPQRREQLLSMYAADGPEALLPTSQDPSLATVEVRGAYIPKNGEFMTSVEVHNPHDFAVDISGWVVTGSENVTAARALPRSKAYCDDEPPKGGEYACEDLVAWGSCQDKSVVKRGVCRRSCGNCREATGPVRFVFDAGTVVPAKSSVYLTDDVVKYRKSLKRHKMFQFALGPLDGDYGAHGGELRVYNDLDRRVS